MFMVVDLSVWVWREYELIALRNICSAPPLHLQICAYMVLHWPSAQNLVPILLPSSRSSLCFAGA